MSHKKSHLKSESVGIQNLECPWGLTNCGGVVAGDGVRERRLVAREVGVVDVDCDIADGVEVDILV